MGRIIETTVRYIGKIEGLVSFAIPLDVVNEMKKVSNDCSRVVDSNIGYQREFCHGFLSTMNARFDTSRKIVGSLNGEEYSFTLEERYPDVLEKLINFVQPPEEHYIMFYKLTPEDIKNKFVELEVGAEYNIKLDLYMSIENDGPIALKYLFTENLDILSLSKVV